MWWMFSFGKVYKTNCDSILKFGRFISKLYELKVNFILAKAVVTEFVYVLFSLLITGVMSFWEFVLFWFRIVLPVCCHILFGLLSVPVFIYTCTLRPEALQALISLLNIICFYLWIQHTISGDICFLSLNIHRQQKE
jgi:hypothetical protein